MTLNSPDTWSQVPGVAWQLIQMNFVHELPTLGAMLFDQCIKQMLSWGILGMIILVPLEFAVWPLVVVSVTMDWFYTNVIDGHGLFMSLIPEMGIGDAVSQFVWMVLWLPLIIRFYYIGLWNFYQRCKEVADEEEFKERNR